MVADVAKKQEYKIKYQGKLLWRKRPSFNFCNFIIQSLGAACASTHPQSMRRRKPLLSFPLIITELYTILVLYFSSRRHGNKIRLFCWRTYKGALSPSSILHSQEKCLCANPNRSRNIISLCPSVRGNTHSFIYIDLLTAKRNLIGSLYEADSHWSLLDNIFLLVANAGRRILLSTRRHCVREYIWFIRLTLKATLFLHGVIANQKRVDGFNMTTNK